MTSEYKVIEGFLSKEEVASLAEYALKTVSTASSVDGITKAFLHNRPDTWDASGIISKGHQTSDDYFRRRNTVGVLESTKFFIRKLDAGSEVEPIVEQDDSRDAQVHGIYRKIAVLVLNDNYEGGETNFVAHGESFKPKAGDLIMYEVSDQNKVGMTRITSGFRLEVVYWYAEVQLKTRFDEFYMPPMEDKSDRFRVE